MKDNTISPSSSPPEPTQIGIPAYSMARPVTVTMLFICILLIGYFSYTKISLALLPEGINFPFLRVWVPYYNSTPQETERKIAIPAEEILSTVRNIHSLNTYSSANGCYISIELEQHTDMDVAYMEVKDRLERLKEQLPNEVERTYIWRFRPTDIPIIYLGVTYDGPLEDAHDQMEYEIRKNIQRIDGIANVEIHGLVKKIITIDVDMNKLLALNVSLYNLVQLLEKENYNVSCGKIQEGDRNYFVRVLGEYHDLDEIENLPVRTGISLSDVAEVEYEYPLKTGVYRINGQESIGLEIQKESMANTVEVARNVLRTLDELEADPRFNKFHFYVFFNMAQEITDSLDGLKNSGFIGAIFAFIVLYTFLRRFSMTILVAIAIPTSIIGTISFLYFGGLSLNIISMMGLMIAVGMLVDNSVVVVENIYRYRQMGYNNRDSAIKGASEVGMAILAGTLTSVIVFFPLIFSEGNIGEYMKEIGIPISISLVLSLAIALSVIPLATSWFLKSKPLKESRFFTKLANLYGGMLMWVLNNKAMTLIILVALIVSTKFVPLDNITFASEPESDDREISIRFELPAHFKLWDAHLAMKKYEEFFEENKEKWEIASYSVFFRTDRGRFHLFLNSRENASRKTKEIRNEISEALPPYPGVKSRIGWEEGQGSSGSISLALRGEDSGRLMEYAEEVKRRLKRVEGITDVDIDIENASDEIHLRVDRTLAQKHGLSPFVIAQTVSFGIRGHNLKDFKTANREVSLYIELQEEQRENLEQLKNIPLQSLTGKLIPLGSVVDFSHERGLGTITRENGSSVIWIKANTEEEDIGLLRQRIVAQMKGFKMPRKYSWDLGSKFQDFDDSMKDIGKTVTLSIILVFLLMGTLFESIFQPLVIILSLIFATPGYLWLMWGTGTTFDFMAWIGVIILVGIVVNNSIVLVDHINKTRREVGNREEAIYLAAKDRLRPILMTAMTTILGLAPMAMGFSSVRFISYAPMGLVVIGGLTTATMGTLFLIPYVYVIFDNVQQEITKMLSSLWYLLKRLA